MSARRPAGSFWPSAQQELLLRVALADPPDALAAWGALRPTLDLQAVDSASFAALPLVYRALNAAESDDPLLPRLKGIYRSVWVRNSVMVDRLQATAETIDAGPPIALLGSIGSALRFYPGLALRPTSSIEFLVEHDAVASALRALGRAGWVARTAGRRNDNEPVVLADREGTLCVLRTALATDFAPRPERDGWPEAEALDVRGVTVQALSPTDELLAAIVAGARAASVGPVQWIVDAAMIVRSEPGRIDWERLARLGTEHGQGLRLREALAYLRRFSGCDAPPAVTRRLDEWRPSGRDRLVYACTTRTVAGLGSLPQAIGEHLAATADRSVPATVAALPAFFRRRWRVERNRQLPLAAGVRAVRVLARRGRAGDAAGGG